MITNIPKSVGIITSESFMLFKDTKAFFKLTNWPNTRKIIEKFDLTVGIIPGKYSQHVV